MASHTQGVAQSASFIRKMTLVTALLVAACHADDNDPKGQAEELADPVRREHAIGRLQSIFSTRLVEAKGDRTHASLKEFADVAHDALTKTYLEHPEDSQNGLKILQLMGEMRDPRTMPALLKALEWQAEVNEDHAVAAAVTLTEIDVPADRKGEVIEKIGAALAKVEGKRPVDVRMRKGFIEVLGKLKDKRTTPMLVEVALKQSENQSFLFNLLATQQLVATADPAAVDAMVKGLYMFDPTNPQNRMNEDAQAVLVAIGPPSLEPLLKTLKGENEEVNALVKLSIETFRRLDPNMASTMVASNLVAHEAIIALGKLGMREALEPLLKETEHTNPERRANAAIALVGLARQDGDTPRILEALQKVYDASEKQIRPQLLVAIRHLYDDAVMPLLLKVATTKEEEFPPAQLYGFISHVMLASKSEVGPLKSLLEKDEDLKPQLKDYDVAIKAAEECDKGVDCWVGKLNDADKIVLRKAANALARFGKGNDKALEGLVGLLGHDDLEVRSEALYAIDHLATKGSKLAVDKIGALQAAEDGRSIWNNFKREALPTRSRLLVRAGS
jgi:HEAT repeat protein